MKNSKTVCAVSTCKSPNGISYFRFPKETEKQKIWIDKCQREDQIKIKSARICETHFSDECFQRDLKNELLGLPLKRNILASAIPDLNLPYQEQPSVSDQEERKRLKEQQELEEQRRYISSLDVSIFPVEDVGEHEISNEDEMEVHEQEAALDIDMVNPEEEDSASKSDKEVQCSIEKGFHQELVHKTYK